MGLVHVYFGDGKGKTTAALGLAFRALGGGMRVCVCQFLKGAPSGEIDALSRFSRAEVLRAQFEGERFFWEMDGEARRACASQQRELLQRALKTSADLFVLDEALDAHCVGALSNDELSDAVEALRARAEIALTGRSAPEWLLSRADYITRMEKLRHPYDRGITARRGIEE